MIACFKHFWSPTIDPRQQCLTVVLYANHLNSTYLQMAASTSPNSLPHLWHKRSSTTSTLAVSPSPSRPIGAFSLTTTNCTRLRCTACTVYPSLTTISMWIDAVLHYTQQLANPLIEISLCAASNPFVPQPVSVLSSRILCHRK